MFKSSCFLNLRQETLEHVRTHQGISFLRVFLRILLEAVSQTIKMRKKGSEGSERIGYEFEIQSLQVEH